MMLRSSSTPVLGSLQPLIPPETPNHHHQNTTLPHKPSPVHKLSFHQKLSCNSSPISPSNGNGGIRRAQSDGNLESLTSLGGGCGGNDDNDDAFGFFNLPKKFSSRPYCSLLQAIPSFSYHNSRFKTDDDESSNDEEHKEYDDGACEFLGVNVENKVLRLNKNKQMGLGHLEKKDDMGDIDASQMDHPRRIGVDAWFGSDSGNGGADGRNLSRVGGEEEGGDSDGGNHDLEDNYRKMVNESIENSLLLGNYAKFLYQTKQDLQGAEEYYSMAILIDPNDGETLSQYAKLIWELHRDKDRATTYFERAVHVASENSHVHASYASFLWETEEEEDNDEEGYHSTNPSFFNNGTITSNATT